MSGKTNIKIYSGKQYDTRHWDMWQHGRPTNTTGRTWQAAGCGQHNLVYRNDASSSSSLLIIHQAVHIVGCQWLWLPGLRQSYTSTTIFLCTSRPPTICHAAHQQHPVSQWVTSLFDLTFAEPIRSAKVHFSAEVGTLTEVILLSQNDRLWWWFTVCTSITSRSFRYASPYLWNQLTHSLRQPRLDLPLPDSSLLHNHLTSRVSSSRLLSSITPSFFHSKLKTFLFLKSYPP